MDSESLNIVMLPDEETSQKAIDLSHQLRNAFPTKFLLNKESVIPHLTIYQAEFPKKNIDLVIGAVEELTKNIEPLNVSMSRFFMFHRGILWWNAKDPKNFHPLQKQFIDKINPLREGCLLPGLRDLDKLSPEEKTEALEFGSIWINSRYSPHISITAVDLSIKDAVMEYLGEKVEQDFLCKKIAVGLSGEYGTFNKILKSFEL
jgi:hypothetical protein